MSGWALAAVLIYGAVGAIVATAHLLLNVGTRGGGSQIEGGDFLLWPLVAVIWLPGLVVYCLVLCLTALLPPRVTRKWW